MNPLVPTCIVSGGQTGADRAALDWAIARGIAHAGWCPQGRLAEDGRLDTKYQLRETESSGYRQRTKLNVRDSDATLILNRGEFDGGTRQTARFAATLNKPCLVVQLDASTFSVCVAIAHTWWAGVEGDVLNIAGPREAKRPGIHAEVMCFLDAFFL